MRAASTLHIAGLVICVGCAAPGQTPTGGEDSSVERASPAGASAAMTSASLRDQLGGAYAVEELLRGPAVLILGDRHVSERSTRWDLEALSPLSAALEVPVHRVIDLSDVPALFAGVARERIAAGARPPGTPLILDWDGSIARRVGAAKSETTVIVLGDHGEERARVTGHITTAKAALVESAMRAPTPDDGLRGER